MALQFPSSWRFDIPPGSSPIPDNSVRQFFQLIARVASQGDRKEILERFKFIFARAVGSTSYSSTSEDWAETDLNNYMANVASNPPLFLEALYDACESAHDIYGVAVPDVAIINRICRDEKIGFEIVPPNIIQTRPGEPPIAVPPPPPTMQEATIQLLQDSILRSEQLLAENRPREAVQEIWWVLESLTTGFKGLNLPGGRIKGRYFNQIATELKNANRGTTLERVVEWCEQLQGYLSSPTGAGVRHGIDLAAGAIISPSEGRLFCNLIRSYIVYLQNEHERLNQLPP